MNNFSISTLHAPWDKNENMIWLGSTLRLVRNIEKCKFPQKLDLIRKKQILALLLKSFSHIYKNFHSINAEELTSTDREFLVEHFLLTDGFHETQSGSAIALDTTGELITLLNFQDHIMIQKTDISGELEKCWADLVAIENELSQKVNFAFAEKFGFLTADPLVCGTGLTISAFLHIPALIHLNRLVETSEKAKTDSIIATGILGHPDELIGDILLVRNQYTLGVNEETILSTVRNAALHFILAEKEARRTIKTEKPPHMIDTISRSLGLLKYSYELEVPETLSALSLTKLGIEIGWITGITVKEINRLLFDCRRSHLRACLAKTLEGQEVLHGRAEYLQQAIQNAELHI